ncbi:MAG: hypothetical protein K2M43_01055 [Mycoplasmoidaceae bacterium]|nr:hypothetical protein [Mycoplasmoidaceae bacterium]
MSYILYYQLHAVDTYMANAQKDPKQALEQLGKLYGNNGIDLNSDESDENIARYLEYSMAYANLFSSAKDTTKFGQSSINISLENSVFTDSSNANGYGFLLSAESGIQKLKYTPDQKTSLDGDGTGMLAFKPGTN